MARRYRTCSLQRLEQRALFAAYISGSSNVYATIQAAVDAAVAGQTVSVDPGNYAEAITINKPLTLRGARAGVDARSNQRGVNETTIIGAPDPNGTNTISCIYVNANGVTVDGFTVQGNSSNGPLGAGIVIAPNRAGTTVINNILQNNVAGLYLSNNSATQPCVIRNNLFFNNNLDGDHSGRGIYTNGGFTGGYLTNVVIDANAFIYNFGSAATSTTLEGAIALQTLAPNSQSNITITNNFFDQNGKAALFYNSDNVLIEGNVITWARDLWSAALRFEGGNSNVTIRGNTMFANPGNVVRIDNKAIAGTNFGFAITGNNIYQNGLNTTTHAAIIVDPGQYSGPLDATNNWWVSAAGPGSAIIANDNNVISSPWAMAPFAHPLEPSYLRLPWSTDGIIQVENFDHGGEGVSYHDLDTSNLGGAKYRQPWGVDLQPTTDAGGGFNLGYAKAGEWLQYTMDIAAAGTYLLDVRVAATSNGGKFHFELDGANITGTMSMLNTGGYQTWKTLTKPSVSLPAGRHGLRLVMETNNSGGSIGNFNWFGFRLDAPLVLPPAAPSNLTADQPIGSSVVLHWSDNSSDENGFVVERKLSGGAWSVLATLPANTTALTDTAVTPGNSYVYRVRAFNSGGGSANSNEYSVAVPVTPVYLSDLPWVSANNGFGPVERDMSNGGSDAGDGDAITLNDVVYPRGLGVHANAEVIYSLGDAYTTFLSDVGVDDKQKNNGSVVFQVFADGVLVFDSGVMGAASATQSVHVNVTGVQTLRLVVSDSGDGTQFDHADWAGARLIPSPPPAPTVPAPPSGLAASAASASRVDLTWSDTTDESSYRIERSANNVDFTAIGTTSANVTTGSDTTVLANTTYYYRVIATNSVGDSSPSNIAQVTTPAPPPPPQTDLPAGWTAGDIGAVGLSGSTNYSGGTWTLKGAGVDIWGSSDSFQFAYRPLATDGTIIARVASLQNTDLNAKAGLMIRDSLAANARHASIVVTPGGGIKFLRRTSTGGSTTATTVSSLKAPYWLKLVRAGSTISSYYSANGTTWTLLASQTVTMGSTVYVGMVVTSKKTSVLATATFDNLAIS